MGNKYALVVGISEYDNLEHLPFCKTDGEKIVALLESHHYEIPDHYRIIEQAKSETMRKSIIDFFTNDDIRADDTLVFYYSGHGVIDSRSSQHYLSASDTDPKKPLKSAFSSHDFSTAISNCTSKRIVIFLDCCFAGSFSIDNSSPTTRDTLSKGQEDAAAFAGREIIEKIIGGEGVCLIAACQGSQSAFGSLQSGHSIFTYYLIEGLKDNPKTVNSVGCVTPDLLANFICEKIMDLPSHKRPRQMPIRKVVASGNIILTCYRHLAKPTEDDLYRLILQNKVTEFNILRQKFYSLDYKGRHFDSLDLTGINLSKVDLYKATFSNVKLEHADLSDSNLEYASMEGINLCDSIMAYAKLGDSHLPLANLSGAVLTKANLSHAHLQYADLSYANLSCADLVESDLSGVSLIAANLSGADIRRANLSGADLTMCDLSFAKYEYADLRSAKSTQDAIFVTPNEPSNSYQQLCSNVNNMEKVRFTAIFDNRRKADQYGGNKPGIKPKLAPHDKSLLLHISWLSWRLREHVIQYLGNVSYVIEKYEQVKLIQIPLTRYNIIMVSTEIDSNHNAIIKYIQDSIPLLHENIRDNLPYPSEYENKISTNITHLGKSFPKIKDYARVRGKIYTLPGIIFADFFGPDFISLTDNMDSYENKMCINWRLDMNVLDLDLLRVSVRNAWRVWRSRNRFKENIGSGRYAIAHYKRVLRITIPLSDSLLFVITKKDMDPLITLSKIMSLV